MQQATSNTERSTTHVMEFKGRYVFYWGGGGGPGYFRIFMLKKKWPSHFPDWINA